MWCLRMMPVLVVHTMDLGTQHHQQEVEYQDQGEGDMGEMLVVALVEGHHFQSMFQMFG